MRACKDNNCKEQQKYNFISASDLYAKNKNRGGVILYNVDEVNDYLNKKGRSTLY